MRATGARRSGHSAAPAQFEAGADHPRRQWPRPIRGQDARLGLEGRQAGRTQFPRLPVVGFALRAGASQPGPAPEPTTMIELFSSVLVTFLVIIDPPGVAPIFASLTRGTPAVHRRAM